MTASANVPVDANATIGTLLAPDANVIARRDAIHVPVYPAVAAYMLVPGHHVGLRAEDGKAHYCVDTIGIVDPFLTANVPAGATFWIMIYPRVITSLRHAWTHPTIPDETTPHATSPHTPPQPQAATVNAAAPVAAVFVPDADAVRELTEFANEIGATYQELIEHATAYVEHGQSWHEGDRFEDYPQVPRNFWRQFERATGIRTDIDDDYGFFSCSC